MRSASDAAKIGRLTQGFGRLARGPGRVYLVGGASAATLGWRLATKVERFTRGGVHDASG